MSIGFKGSLIEGSVSKNSLMRFCEAAALCIILAVMPMALTGKVSMLIYMMNSTMVSIPIL